MSWITEEVKPGIRRNRAIKMFHKDLIEKGKTTHHSGQGHTLKLEIERLEEARVPYRITAYPGEFYQTERMPSLEEFMDHRDDQKRALELIASLGCEHYTSGGCADEDAERSPYSKFGYNSWCHACIAKAGLAGTLPARPLCEEVS